MNTSSGGNENSKGVTVDWSYVLTGGCLVGVTACLTLLFQTNTELVALRTKMEYFREVYAATADRFVAIETRIRTLEVDLAILKQRK